MFRYLNPLSLAFLWAFLPRTGFAHPAEQALVLLLPTELYTLGGTLAVAASILLLSLTSRDGIARAYQGFRVSRGSEFKNVALFTSLASTLAFFALIYVGFSGPNDPQRNVLPLTIWTGWWVGLFIVQGVLSDVWKWINPWTGIYEIVLGTGEPILRMPSRLGAWPALMIFLAFQGFILADIAPNDPERLATLALFYWMFTFGHGRFRTDHMEHSG